MTQRVALIAFITTAILAFSAPTAEAVTYTVNSTADAPDNNVGDEVCSTAAGVCTLRAAIQEANDPDAPGDPRVNDTINFSIPFLFPNNCGIDGPWCTIGLTSNLPVLTDSGTTIDGFSQPDTNPGSVPEPPDEPVRPGVLDGANPCPELTFQKPDVAVNGNNVARNIFTIGSTADDITIQGLSIYNAAAIPADGHAIVGQGAPSFATAPQDRDVIANFVGVLPDGSDPGVALRNKQFGIRQLTPGYMQITNNFVGHNGKGGIDAEASQTVVEVERNEVFENGGLSDAHDGIDINGIYSYCACNYSHHNTNVLAISEGDSGTGIEVGSKSPNTLDPNDFDQNITNYNTVEMNLGGGLSIRANPRGNIFIGNVSFRNRVGIVVDTEARAPNSTTNRNEFSRNSTFQNMMLPMGPGIDLLVTKPGSWTGFPDGSTMNDRCDPDGGGATGDGDPANNQSNDLQNFPVLDSATSLGGSMLEIQGSLDSWPGRRYRIEFFRTPAGDNTGFAEGKEFIGVVYVTTAAAPDCTASFTVTLTISVPAGDEITATATRDENPADEELGFGDVWSTSEYSAPAVVDLLLPEGKVTGGGFILQEPVTCDDPCDDDNASTFRANYGFNASYHKDNLDPFGHTNFVYKPGNIHLNSQDYVFASLRIERDLLDPRKGTARWRGSAKVNNKKGFCFEVFVRDDGEPGTTDRWQIKIWSNQAAASDGEVCAADGAPFYDSGNQMVGGGNIQLHPTNP